MLTEITKVYNYNLAQNMLINSTIKTKYEKELLRRDFLRS